MSSLQKKIRGNKGALSEHIKYKHGPFFHAEKTKNLDNYRKVI